jgi:serine/threonine protein kinase
VRKLKRAFIYAAESVRGSVGRNRGQVPLQDGFVEKRKMGEKSRRRFEHFLHEKGYDQADEMTILQENIWRKRIVCKITRSNDVFVVKWVDNDAELCFNYTRDIAVEVEHHFNTAGKYPNLFIRGREHSGHYLVMDYFEGEILTEFAVQNQQETVLKQIGLILDQLMLFYKREEETDPFSNLECSRYLMEQYHQGVQTLGPMSWKGVWLAFKTPEYLYKNYVTAKKKVAQTISDHPGKFRKTWIIRDLSVSNILINSEKSEFRIVDLEDIVKGIYTFDLAFLCCRLIAVSIDYPLHFHKKIIQLFSNRIAERDSVHLTVFYSLLYIQLVHLFVNPWQWPESSNWNLSSDKILTFNSKLNALLPVMNTISEQGDILQEV